MLVWGRPTLGKTQFCRIEICSVKEGRENDHHIYKPGKILLQEEAACDEEASSTTLGPDDALREKIEYLLLELQQSRAELQILRRQVIYHLTAEPFSQK